MLGTLCWVLEWNMFTNCSESNLDENNFLRDVINDIFGLFFLFERTIRHTVKKVSTTGDSENWHLFYMFHEFSINNFFTK